MIGVLESGVIQHEVIQYRMICAIQHEFDEFNVLNSQELLCISDMAAACYCGCKDQLEPEPIELLAAMTDVVVQL